MPNHLHVLIKLNQQDTTINNVISEGKRFRAYEIVKRLKQMNEADILRELENGVSELEKRKNSRHKVFETSFDCKECYTGEFIQQKLLYMHNNPVSKHWALADKAENYLHSSARFYSCGMQGIYPVSNYLEFYDVPVAK